MIKRISTRQLRPGMYIQDLNCGWLDHPFFANHFRVKDEAQVAQIVKHGIREVYIDTDKGGDVADAPSRQTVQEALQRQLDKVAEEAPAPAPDVSADEERTKAVVIQREASRLVGDIMEDVRLGRQIEVERVQGTVDRMISSIFRNKDALLSLGRIRRMDHYTFEHSLSVGILMLAFAKEFELEPGIIAEIGVGALLHDIGKIRIANEILNKPGRLTEREFAIMKSHVVLSRDILAATPGISPTALSVAAEHHERMDGTGYPDGLKGEEISLYGQMAAIVDVYDAISSDRCYHKGQEPTQVLRKLLEWSQYHFNPRLVHAFIHCVGIYPPGTLVRLASGRLALVIELGKKGLLYPQVRVIYDSDKRRYLTPYDIDFSTAGGEGERILGSEPAEKWGIPVEQFLL